jgi:hypothetical protein
MARSLRSRAYFFFNTNSAASARLHYHCALPPCRRCRCASSAITARPSCCDALPPHALRRRVRFAAPATARSRHRCALPPRVHRPLGQLSAVAAHSPRPQPRCGLYCWQPPCRLSGLPSLANTPPYLPSAAATAAGEVLQLRPHELRHRCHCTTRAAAVHQCRYQRSTCISVARLYLTASPPPLITLLPVQSSQYATARLTPAATLC